MVSEATNLLFAGIISGWLVAVTHPIITWIVNRLAKLGASKIVTYPILYIMWLLALMVFVLIIYH